MNTSTNTDGNNELAMLADARRGLSDLFKCSRALFWSDFLATVAVLWSAVALGSSARTGFGVSAACFVVAFLAAHRGAMFMHEITHLSRGAVPGLKFAWNALLGIPLLLPSYLYERMHLDHHRLEVYGTTGDPEYAPHARMSAGQTLTMSVTGVVLPVALVIRWLVVTPVSFTNRKLRAWVELRANALTANLVYRPKALRGKAATAALAAELVTSIWAWLVVAGLSTSVLSVRPVLFTFAVFLMVTALNQVRSLASHRYENVGAKMTQLGQLLDSVNIPELTPTTAVLLPVGARFHALHHWCPAIPYHSLPKAHARLLKTLPPESSYRKTISPRMTVAVGQLLRSGNAFVASRVEVAP